MIFGTSLVFTVYIYFGLFLFLRYFDGSINPDLKDPEFTNIPSILYNATTNSTLKEDFEKLIANDASVTLLGWFLPFLSRLFHHFY